jgi:pre-mRNA-splicing helicase BRR2
LASASDQRSIENELVLSLGFEQFELIKELIKNRLRIVWCTKLSRAQVNS